MKTCPQCKTTGIPDEAKFCPNCGTMLHAEEPIKKMTISECRLIPSIIRKGEQCRLVWKGENVSSILVDDKPYQIYEDIILRPNQSHTYNIAFVDRGGYVNGKVIREQLNVTVKSPYLFDGKGVLSPYERFYIVDARQCSRKSGLGMDADYIFNPGLPIGSLGFYAVLEEKEDLQFVIDGSKLTTIYLRGHNGNILKIWRGERKEEYRIWEGSKLFGDWVTKTRHVPQLYYAFFNKQSDTLIQETQSARADTFDLLHEYDSQTYKNEITAFLGTSLSQLLKDAIECKE